jgi:putative colanic acid biosynthesis glycosyltransferase
VNKFLTYKNTILKKCNLTIITVTRNNFDSLKETYHSVINSSVYPEQWIIVDGNSTDKTKEYFSKLVVSGIKYFFLSEPDDGIYDAMNKGIRIAECDYLLFLNAGDMLSENSLPQEINEAIQLNFITTSYFGSKRTRMLPEWYGIPAPHQAFIFPNIKDPQIMYDMQYSYAADYDYYLKYRKLGVNFRKNESGAIKYQRGGFSDGDYIQASKEKNIVVKKYFGPCMYLLVSFMDSCKIILKKALRNKSPYVKK